MSRKEKVIGIIAILALLALAFVFWVDRFSRCLEYNNNDVYYCALQK